MFRSITLLSSFALCSAAFALPTWDFNGYSVDRASVKVQAAVYGNQFSEEITKTGLTEGVDPAGISATARGSSLLRNSYGGYDSGSATVQSNLSFTDGSITYGGSISRSGYAVPSLAQNIEFTLAANSDIEVSLSAGGFAATRTTLYLNGIDIEKNVDGVFSPLTLKSGDVLTTRFENYGIGINTTMSITPVPEPVTVLGLGFGSVILLRRRCCRPDPGLLPPGFRVARPARPTRVDSQTSSGRPRR